MDTPVFRLGPVSVYLGEKSGKYPDGNQVVVQGADTRAAFDTPLVANRLGSELLDADLVVLGTGITPNAEIAAELFLSQKTVRNYVSSIFAKLQVADRAEAGLVARAAGLGEQPLS